MIVYRYVNQSRLSGARRRCRPGRRRPARVGVLAWTQGPMVLMLAAAYGADPAHPDRAVDLLVLQGIHKYTQTARTALASPGRERFDALLPDERPSPQGPHAPGPEAGPDGRVRAVKKDGREGHPGLAIILGGVTNGNATRALGGPRHHPVPPPVMPATPRHGYHVPHQLPTAPPHQHHCRAAAGAR
ncbi:hypothetical protein GCM10020218_049960 [Dactylosporangium vinaceum]